MNIKKNGLMAAAPNMGDEPQNAEEVVNCTSDEGCVGKEFTYFFENEELEEEVTKQDLESEQVGQMRYYPSLQDEDEETSKEDSSMTLSCTVILWRSGRMELSTQDAEDDKVLRKVFNRLIKGRYYAYDYAEKSVTFEPYALPQKGKEKVKAFMFGGEWTKTSVNYEFRYFVPRQSVLDPAEQADTFLEEMESMAPRLPYILHCLEKASTCEEFFHNFLSQEEQKLQMEQLRSDLAQVANAKLVGGRAYGSI